MHNNGAWDGRERGARRQCTTSAAAVHNVSKRLLHNVSKRPPAWHPCLFWQIFGVVGRLRNLSREARWRLRRRRKRGREREEERGGEGGGRESQRGTARGRMRAKRAPVPNYITACAGHAGVVSICTPPRRAGRRGGFAVGRREGPAAHSPRTAARNPARYGMAWPHPHTATAPVHRHGNPQGLFTPAPSFGA